MKDNKLIIILLIILVGIFSSSMVYATEEVNIEGINFKIPEGYHKIEKDSIGTTFQNDAGDEIFINVNTTGKPVLENGQPATIKDKQGTLLTAASDTDSFTAFEYQEDNKDIIIRAPSQSIIEEIIS